MVNQDLSKYLPDWKERGIAVVNASPIAMGLFRKDGPQPWHPAQKELKVPIFDFIKRIFVFRKRLKHASSFAMRKILTFLDLPFDTRLMKSTAILSSVELPDQSSLMKTSRMLQLL
jgi:hypothetical protein